MSIDLDTAFLPCNCFSCIERRATTPDPAHPAPDSDIWIFVEDRGPMPFKYSALDRHERKTVFWNGVRWEGGFSY